MNRAIFFDIDGTLTGILSGETFKQNPHDVAVLPGVEAGLNYYNHQNPKWVMIGISNQGGVAAGYKSIEDTIAEMRLTLALLPQLQAIYFCPDFDGLICWRVTNTESVKLFDGTNDEVDIPPQTCHRKPGAGMIYQGVTDFRIDLSQSWVVGDRQEDEEAATNANCNFMSADIWRNRFLPEIYQVKPATPAQVEFLEGVRISDNLTDLAETRNLLQPPDWSNN